MAKRCTTCNGSGEVPWTYTLNGEKRTDPSTKVACPGPCGGDGWGPGPRS